MLFTDLPNSSESYFSLFWLKIIFESIIFYKIRISSELQFFLFSFKAYFFAFAVESLRSLTSEFFSFFKKFNVYFELNFHISFTKSLKVLIQKS